MKLSEIRDTYSWQGAIALGPKLMQLAEEMPATEELGLGMQLRQAMVELPATIAADLIKGREPQLLIILKLVVALELIDKVYPALDTADARKTAEDLLERMASGNASDRPGSVRPAAAPAHPAVHAVRPEVAAKPADTPITPAEAAEPPVRPAVKVEPTTDHQPEEVHVHADSGQ